MSALADIYDDDFFTTYGVKSAAYVRACSFIAEHIHDRFQPRSVIDWGCGAGLHSAALKRRGVDVIAIDGVAVAADLVATGVEIVIADLATPVPSDLVFANYDLSLCIDVMEHLSAAAAGAALANITRGADLVVLSCAPPGQGGHHHVNEQPRRYWVARMAALGWSYDRRETGAMETHFLAHRDQLPLSWMYHNLCVYRPDHDRR